MNMSVEKVFEGCKHPELIDEYIRGVKEGAKQSKLQALKQEVEEMSDFTIDNQFQDGYKKALTGVINHINNLEE